MMRCHGDRAQNYGGGAHRASQESATSQRHWYHPDGPYRAATGGGIAHLRSPTPTPRQGSLYAHFRRTESGPMIAADTSTWVAFLEGGAGEDTQLLDKALEDRQVVMVPAVLTELLSDPKLPIGVAETLSDVPLIEIESGYWQRAGELRAKVLAKRLKARLGDALIAQSCIDGGVPLLTRDRDFRAFAKAARLDLILRGLNVLARGDKFIFDPKIS